MARQRARGTVVTWVAGALAATFAACNGCPVPAPPGSLEELIDAGHKRAPRDAGEPDFPLWDGGLVFSNDYAAEPCAPEDFTPPDDAGLPARYQALGLCIALRQLSGTALLNDQPVVQGIDLELHGQGFGAQAAITPDADGGYAVRAMRAYYPALRYHPSGIFPTHQGALESGAIDLRIPRVVDLKATSHKLSGNVSFGASPWTPSMAPDDVRLGAVGIPSAQGVTTTSAAGQYEVALLQGTFAVLASVPKEALGGETEVLRHIANASLKLDKDQLLDVAIPASALDTQLLLDGAPYPDRQSGPDFMLEYYPAGGLEPTARTYHEGGQAGGTRVRVPKGLYRVNLSLNASPHRELPTQLINKQLAAPLDLTKDGAINVALHTVRVEGAILIDGVPITPSQGYAWNLYAYAYDGSEPPFVAYYQVPFESPSFSLRFFPGAYYLALYLDEPFAPGLAHGWYVVDGDKVLTQDTHLPIAIETEHFEGRLLIDGAPAIAGKASGWLYLQQLPNGNQFRRRVVTDVQGRFDLRVPKGKYELQLELDPRTYPAYAIGRQRVGTVDLLQGPKSAELLYDTVAFAGPLRIAQALVPDAVPGGPEVGLLLRRSDRAFFRWTGEGGQPWYLMRVPVGDYVAQFEILKGAYEDVAHGTAPLGLPIGARQ